jgi:hypothetical protein
MATPAGSASRRSGSQAAATIEQGTVKNNDHYFGNSSYQYNTAEMQHVIGQEVGHTFGLDHQDESGISLNTCMDYYHNTSASDTKSTHPNSHDYSELSTIYSHLDSTTTIGMPTGAQLVPLGSVGESKYVSRLANGKGGTASFLRSVKRGHDGVHVPLRAVPRWAAGSEPTP